MNCVSRTSMWLPDQEFDYSKWAVIACDQHTGEPEYWERVKNTVGDAPSALNIIYPEVYLEGDSDEEYLARIAKIQKQMETYLDEKVLKRRVKDGYVVVSRVTEAGNRLGLVALLDLEEYEYQEDTKKPIRATERTVPERIPVRVGIREGAPVEMPHVMMLYDDVTGELEPVLADIAQTAPVLYDAELMENGGRLTGHAVEGELEEKVTSLLNKLQKDNQELFLAVGDGNHSLAAAKVCWERAKKSIPEKEQENHPLRYALVEINCVQSEALEFHPIHRIVYNIEGNVLVSTFAKWLESHGASMTACEENPDFLFVMQGEEKGYCLADKEILPIVELQNFLDDYTRKNQSVLVDYLHNEETTKALAEAENSCGVILGAFAKDKLFATIRKMGVLPRKSFSIGEEHQKRYYCECRSLK